MREIIIKNLIRNLKIAEGKQCPPNTLLVKMVASYQARIKWYTVGTYGLPAMCRFTALHTAGLFGGPYVPT
jgi:hypothetical protein